MVVEWTRDHSWVTRMILQLVHTTDFGWNLHLFASTVQHTKKRHIKKIYVQHFSEVTKQWDVLGSDSSGNMKAAEGLVASGSIKCPCLNRICLLSFSKSEITLFKFSLLLEPSKQPAVLTGSGLDPSHKIKTHCFPSGNSPRCRSSKTKMRKTTCVQTAVKLLNHLVLNIVAQSFDRLNTQSTLSLAAISNLNWSPCEFLMLSDVRV